MREINFHKSVEGKDRILVDPVSREVKALNLSGLDLPELNLAFIERYPEVERLSLNRNLLKRLDLTPLQTCRDLKVLDLGCNDFYGFLLDLTPLEQCPLEQIFLEGDITLASDEPNISKVKLGKFPHLETLDMHQNALKEVDLSRLAGCIKLDMLDLSWNQLEKANLEQLSACKNLRILNLNVNHLLDFPPEACIPSLHELKLGSNRLTRLPAEIGNLSKLESLDVSSNPLESLSFSFSNLNALKSLNLAKVCLKDSPNIRNLPPGLLEVNLHNASEALIKAALQPFRHLVALTLSSDNLEVIPEIVQIYETLEELDLGFNKITCFPKWFGHLTSLKKLDLSGNPFTSLPEEIFSLKNLKTLTLRKVPLTLLPPQLLDLPSLKTLFISDKFAADPLVTELMIREVQVICRDNYW